MITRHPARTSWSRRDMLRGSAAALIGAYGLAPRYGLAADIPTEYDGSKFQIAAPEPNPKRGGVMRYGILNRPPHFDVHRIAGKSPRTARPTRFTCARASSSTTGRISHRLT